MYFFAFVSVFVQGPGVLLRHTIATTFIEGLPSALIRLVGIFAHSCAGSFQADCEVLNTLFSEGFGGNLEEANQGPV